MLRARLQSPVRTFAGLAVLLCLPQAKVQFVTAAGAPLLAIPGPAGAPHLGQLYPGAAVRIEEDRGDFVRISLQAWVPREDLSPERPRGLGDPELPPEETPDTPPPAPLTDLNKAYYVRVDTIEPVEAGTLAVRLSLATREGVTVELPDQPLPLVLNVFNERRVGNSMVRDELLWTAQHELDAASREFSVPLAEIVTEGSRIVTVSVKVQLVPARTLLGSHRGILVSVP